MFLLEIQHTLVCRSGGPSISSPPRPTLQMNDGRLCEIENFPTGVMHPLGIICVVDIHEIIGIQSTDLLAAGAADKHAGAANIEIGPNLLGGQPVSTEPASVGPNSAPKKAADLRAP